MSEVELKRNEESSFRLPPVDTNGIRPDVREEIARLVVVADVPVAFVKERFEIALFVAKALVDVALVVVLLVTFKPNIVANVEVNESMTPVVK